MSFDSFAFLFFFIAVLAIVRKLPLVWKNRFLVAASYLFYGAWDWRFLGLILFSTALDYVCALRIESNPAASSARKRWLALSVAGNLGVLAFFKYYGFFAESFAALFALVGWRVSWPTLSILLPVGISFYTFQTLSYTLEVYRGNFRATRDFGLLALYVSFFPQLVAGPIEKPQKLIPQFVSPPPEDAQRFALGFHLALWGLFKKVYVADNLGAFIDPILAPNADPGAALLYWAYFVFSFQIYADFSGYSDIARGCAKMLGYELSINFRFSWLASSPIDFWKRWHLTLSGWVRDYVYMPLGGGRVGSIRKRLNLFLAMGLVGLWHGASWGFVLWGWMHAVFISVQRALSPWLPDPDGGGAAKRTVLLVSGILFYLQLRTLSSLTFRTPSLEAVEGNLSIMLSFASSEAVFGLREWIKGIGFYLLPMMALEGLQWAKNDAKLYFKVGWPVRSLFYAGLILLMALYGYDQQQPFYYYQF